MYQSAAQPQIARAETAQKIFNPINFNFAWTADWYAWDGKAGRTAALQARNAEVKRLKGAGWTVTTFCLADQLVRRGGIGTGHPDVEFHVSCYGLNARRDTI